jgi:hypothetical protein
MPEKKEDVASTDLGIKGTGCTVWLFGTSSLKEHCRYLYLIHFFMMTYLVNFIKFDLSLK